MREKYRAKKMEEGAKGKVVSLWRASWIAGSAKSVGSGREALSPALFISS